MPQTAKTRPGFARKPSQPILGPFFLDQRKNIKVPGGINTFLREYQRDGIRFFYERYVNGRGGLLGDDMGLVRYYLRRRGKMTDTSFAGKDYPSHFVLVCHYA